MTADDIRIARRQDEAIAGQDPRDDDEMAAAYARALAEPTSMTDDEWWAIEYKRRHQPGWIS